MPVFYPRMIIGFFTDTFPPQSMSGVGTAVIYFTQILRKAGHRVYIIAPKVRGYTKKEKDLYRIPSSKLPSIPDSARIPVLLPDYAWKDVFWLHYDVIHAHGNGFFSLLALIIAKTRHIPFVLTCHTIMDDYAHYFFRGKVLTPKMVHILFRICFNTCDELIAPSEKMVEYLHKIGVKKHITVIPNYLDLKKFKVKNTHFLHKKYGIPTTTQIILAVGRLGKEKNFQFLIKTIPQVLKEIPTCHLVIIGEGFERKKLQKEIEKLRISKHVHLVGSVDTTLMPRAYADADIFVSGSITEVHPMTVMEAAAAGLPLVLANDSAFKREIHHGENGFFLPLDSNLFAEKILLLLRDTRLAKKFGERSLEIVKKNMDEQKIVKQLMTVYRKLQNNSL